MHGLPVVGKSALAKRLVEEFSSIFIDRRFIVDLKGVTEHYLNITDAMIQVIRVIYPDKVLSTNESEVRGIYQSCFYDKKCILLIENVGLTKQIEELLPSSAKACLVIITSRKDLALEETFANSLKIRLGVLSEKDSILFLKSIVPTIPDSEAAKIVKLCGYLPLAIRIVGSTLVRRANLTVENMISQLNDVDSRLAMMESSVKGVLEFIPPEMKPPLFALSIFPGSFDGIAAAAVLDQNYNQMIETLGSLLEYSFFEFDVATGRYTQNDLLQLFIYKTVSSLPEQKESLIQWKTNFIRYFTKFLFELTNEISKDKIKASDKYHLEEHNFEVAFQYCLELQKNDLLQSLSQTLNTIKPLILDEIEQVRVSTVQTQSLRNSKSNNE